MSQEITDSFVNQYSSNVFHLSQQKGSKLNGFVRTESQKGESAFYDRIGSVAAVKKSGRHASTPQLDTPHSRRMVTLTDYEWADLVDDQDKIRSLNDPTNDYVLAAMWAMGRAMDDEIISAAGGNAYSGQKGTTTVALPNAQKQAATNGTAHVNLNLLTLRLVKKTLDDADVPMEDRHFAMGPSQLYSLLGQTEVGSSDYNTIKSLVQGELDTFMGFKFHMLTRLLTEPAGSSQVAADATGVFGSGTSVVGYRKCYAWHKPSLLLAIGQDIKSRISERDDKSYATQVYSSMSLGATRMEEVPLVEVYCKE